MGFNIDSRTTKEIAAFVKTLGSLKGDAEKATTKSPHFNLFSWFSTLKDPSDILEDIEYVQQLIRFLHKNMRNYEEYDPEFKKKPLKEKFNYVKQVMLGALFYELFKLELFFQSTPKTSTNIAGKLDTSLRDFFKIVEPVELLKGSGNEVSHCLLQFETFLRKPRSQTYFQASVDNEHLAKRVTDIILSIENRRLDLAMDCVIASTSGTFPYF